MSCLVAFEIRPRRLGGVQQDMGLLCKKIIGIINSKVSKRTTIYCFDQVHELIAEQKIKMLVQFGMNH